MSRHRVLFIHHRPQPSGAAQSLALLIGALSDEWEAHVLVPGGAAAELFKAAGATVHRAPVPAFTHTWDVQYRGLRWLVAVRELLWAPAHRRALRRLLQELHPALVHLNDSVLLASAIVAHKAGVPVIWHLRSSLANEGRDRRSRWIQRTIDRYGVAAIAIDEDVARTFRLEIPIHVIDNPVNAESGDPLDLGLPAECLAVGWVGYLRRQKGWPEFLQALRLVLDRGGSVHGIVVGGAIRPPSSFRGWRGRLLAAVGVPNEQEDFEAEVERLGLAQHVTLLPFTNDVGAVYRALDILVFPNQGTGLGRPVLEAAAYGIPVVASGSPRGGGVVVPDATALLLLDGSAEALSRSLQRLAQDGSLRKRLGHDAKIRSVQTEPAAVSRRVVDVYRSAVHPLA